MSPFDWKKGKEFVPSFLSGFYADTNDVAQYVYLQEAEELVNQDAPAKEKYMESCPSD